MFNFTHDNNIYLLWLIYSYLTVNQPNHLLKWLQKPFGHKALHCELISRYLVFFSYIKYPLGYVDIGLIPEGAWGIHIEEVAEAGNFLALRSDNPNKYFLNGGWTIQWNGEYKAAGTVFTYERTGQLENLTSPGPTMEPLWIQVGLTS